MSISTQLMFKPGFKQESELRLKKNTFKRFPKNVNGNINFVHGTRQFLSTPLITKKPQLGKMFIFPNYLMHSVNPFYGKGERRSISFNANVNEEIYDVYSL